MIEQGHNLSANMSTNLSTNTSMNQSMMSDTEVMTPRHIMRSALRGNQLPQGAPPRPISPSPRKGSEATQRHRDSVLDIIK